MYFLCRLGNLLATGRCKQHLIVDSLYLHCMCVRVCTVRSPLIYFTSNYCYNVLNLRVPCTVAVILHQKCPKRSQGHRFNVVSISQIRRDREWLLHSVKRNWNESVPIQLAQCRFPGVSVLKCEYIVPKNIWKQFRQTASGNCYDLKLPTC